jgi:hypothetical protein
MAENNLFLLALKGKKFSLKEKVIPVVAVFVLIFATLFFFLPLLTK